MGSRTSPGKLADVVERFTAVAFFATVFLALVSVGIGERWGIGPEEQVWLRLKEPKKMKLEGVAWRRIGMRRSERREERRPLARIFGIKRAGRPRSGGGCFGAGWGHPAYILG